MSYAHAIGLASPPVDTVIERGRLRLFARAIGESDPVYTDVDAANAAGLPDLLVPPTYLFGADMDGPDSQAYIEELGIDMRAVLHGEQEFAYFRPVYAGDRLRAQSTIVDAYEKKDGMLKFLVRETVLTRAGELVAQLRSTLVVRELDRTGTTG